MATNSLANSVIHIFFWIDSRTLWDAVSYELSRMRKKRARDHEGVISFLQYRFFVLLTKSHN